MWYYSKRELLIPICKRRLHYERSWYYKDKGMTALDLLRMMQEYKFVREAVEGSLPLENS
jgi:hypothetical protein